MTRVHTDLSAVPISVAPSPATSGTSLGVTDANAAYLPDTYPYWAVLVPTGESPTRANSEVVKVTADSSSDGTTTLTIVRAQGIPATTAQSVTTSFDIYDANSIEALETGILTFTNKRITPRIVSAASYTTDTGTALNSDDLDMFIVTAQAGALKFNNPGGTPTQGQKILIRVKDDGTARALTYDTQFRAMGVDLPSTTVLSKTLYMGFIYNSTDTKWDIVASAQEA